MANDWIDVVEAWTEIETRVQPLGSETVSLAAARDRILASPVEADRDVPPFDRAAMDGFAVRSADVAGASDSQPVSLRVAGEVTPGATFAGAAVAGSAVRIMTGAAVPAGFDAVVPVEQTSGFDTDPVGVAVAAPPGANIAPRGSERRAGERTYEAGTQLSSADVGGLAMLGCTQVEVGRRPRVAVLATGNELVAADRSPGPTQIRNSNTPMLLALAAGSAAALATLGPATDEPRALRDWLGRGLQDDLLLVTGGVSAGAYDFVAGELEALGVRIHFRKVAMQPGKPVVFGTHDRGVVFALPGNPVSAWTTFRLLAAPAILRLQGAADVRPRWATLPAAFTWRRRHSKWLFLPGCMEGERLARVRYAGSGDLLAYARADGQIVLPPSVESVEPGDPVRFWPRGAAIGVR